MTVLLLGLNVLHKIYQVLSKLHYRREVRIVQEVLVLYKVLNLVVVVICESLGFALLKVLRVELLVLVVFNSKGFELVYLCPIIDVSNLKIAH